ncbi:MAG TPA: MmgE/PrpD family protein [Devosia sp.]|nr:MmgE/PrpD family protein [Devosia sp.]
MSFLRNLALKEMEEIERSSVAYRLASYGLGLQYDAIPKDAVHMAKRALLDALGCALGGLASPGYPMLREFAQEFGGPAESTIIGSGEKTSAFNATLVNSFLVRFLDYNDMGGGCHNTDAISNLLAVAERQKTTGIEFLATLVASYELGVRVDMSVDSWDGWVRDLRASLTVPPTIGRLLGLNEMQIANAIGILASGNLPLGILDAGGEERVMRKNLRFGWSAAAGVVACLMAKRGFTGPVRVLEGEEGISEVLFGGKMDFDQMTDFRGFRIIHTRFKYLAACSGLHTSIYATLDLVKENDIKPEDIAQVFIKIGSADLMRPTIYQKYPRNAETADHSVYYTNAIAIVDRDVGPASANPERFSDPRVIDLIEKMHVSRDPEFPPREKGPNKLFYTNVGWNGKSEIVLKDGRRFSKHIVTPHGFGNDPLSDKELEEKFADMAQRYMSKDQVKKIFETIWDLESVTDMGSLMSQMVATKNKPH